MGVSITEATLLHHVCVVLFGLWFLNAFYYCHPVAYFLSFIYLYLVHDGYVLRLTKKLQFEEKRDSYQNRVLSDSETVRWLNLAVEKMWLVCMEEIVSKKILLPIVPWFLQKYKPWTVKDIEVQNLYLGRSPPIFTDMRIRPHSNGDDHLVMELGMNFRTADDMCSVLSVKLKKRVGFGMLAKLNLLGMHVEGKVLVGVKFLKKWPFIGRLRVCFVEPPYFQMTVKPIFSHGLDVTELPGIAGWIDNLLALVFEETLVEPNMLVVDVEKFVSPEPENWFSVDAKESIAHAIVEVIEGVEMNPSDLNGLADPYVKGQLGPYRFRTKIQKKTLCPKWREEFKVPISTWDSQNVLAIEVRDKDHMFDDLMGDCSVIINELRGGQRHDIWLPLQNIKTGRLHLAVTVSEGNEKMPLTSTRKQSKRVRLRVKLRLPRGHMHREGHSQTAVVEPSPYADRPNRDNIQNSFADDSTKKGSFSSRTIGKSLQASDKFEPIDIDGQPETGIWIHHPGSEIGQKWEPRKGKSRNLSSRNLYGKVKDMNSGDLFGSVNSVSRTSSKNDSSSTDESTDAKKSKSKNPVRKGLRKFGSLFQRSSKKMEQNHSLQVPEQSPRDNIKAENTKKSGVRLIVHEVVASPSPKNPTEQKHLNDEGKSMLMNAENPASSVEVVLCRKASDEHKAESGLSPAGENEVLDQNSSDDESLSSSDNTGNGLATPDSSSKVTLPGNSSFKSTDQTITTDPQPVSSANL